MIGAIISALILVAVAWVIMAVILGQSVTFGTLIFWFVLALFFEWFDKKYPKLSIKYLYRFLKAKIKEKI